MMGEFEMSNFGLLNSKLGIEVLHKKSQICLKQEASTLRIL